MIEEAIRYQTQGEDRLKRVGIGGGLIAISLIFGIFLLPLALLFTINGYMLEVMRRVMGGDTENPPAWGELDLVDITVDGLKHVVIVLPYSLAAMAIAGIPFGILFMIGAVAESGIFMFLAFGIGGLLYLVTLLVLMAVIPVATANFVRKDSIAAGFDLGILRTIVPNRTMLMAVLIGVVINILMSAAASILGFTFVGLLAVPFVQFIGQSAIFYVWADGFADAYEEEYGEAPLAIVTEADTDSDAAAPAEDTA